MTKILTFKFFKDFNGFTPPYSILAHSVVGRWQNYKFMSSTFWHFLQKAIHKFYPSYFTPILGFNNRRCWSPTVFSGWGLTPPPFCDFGPFWTLLKKGEKPNFPKHQNIVDFFCEKVSESYGKGVWPPPPFYFHLKIHYFETQKKSLKVMDSAETPPSPPYEKKNVWDQHLVGRSLP